MTRKKSNVKALALAVTCAILAGGYSGLNPVYAVDVTESFTDVTITGTVGGTAITDGKASGEITISGSSIASALNGEDISSAKVKGTNDSTGATLKDVYDKVLSNDSSITALKTKTTGITYSDDTTTVGGVGFKSGGISAANGSFTVNSDTGKITTTADGSMIGKLRIDKDKLSILGNSVTQPGTDTYVELVKYSDLQQLSQKYTDTSGVTHFSGTTGEGTSIENGNLKVYKDKKLVTINEEEDQQVIIDSNGIKVGKNSAHINEDGFSVGDPTDSKNKLTKDGLNASAINAGANNTEFTVDGNGNTAVGGTLNSKGNFSVGDNDEFTVDGATGNVVTKGGVQVGTSSQQVLLGGGGVIATNGTDSVTLANGAVTATGAVTGSIIQDGAGAQMSGGNITATGKAKSKTLAAGTNGDEFTVDENGNVVAKGTLQTTGDISTDGNVTAKGTLSAADGKFEVDADGAVSAAGGNFGVDKDGNTTVGGTLGVTGATNLGSTLDVTGKTTLKDALDVKGKATFGNAPGALTEIDGDKLTTGVITTDKAQESSIGGVKMANGKITADNMTITGTLDMDNLKVNENLSVGTFGVTKAGVVTGVTSINGASVTANGTGLKIGTATVGDSNPFTSQGFTVDATGNIAAGTYNGASITSTKFNGAEIDATGNITAGTYNGNTITADKKFNDVKLDSGNVEATKVTAGTITDGNGFTATNGNVSAKDITADNISATTGTIAGVNFATGGNVTGVNNLTATGIVQAATLKVNDNNVLDSNGLKAEKAVIDNITIDGASITSSNADGSVGIAGITVDKTGALTGVNAIDGVKVAGGNTAGGLTIGDGATAVTIGGNSMALSSTNFGVDNDGDVTGQSFTAGSSYLKDGELKLNDANIWTTAEGIKAEKATIGANTLDSTGFSTTGSLSVAGKATFGSNAGDSTTIEQGAVSVTQNGKTTTIKGGEIETDKLTVNDIVLKNSMKDDSGNTITISGTDGSMSVASGAFAVDKEGQLTNKITGTEGGYTYATNLATSKTGINANYTNGVNGNNNLLSINKDGVALGVTDSTNQKLGGFAANEDNASLSYGDDNSIVVDETTITSALGSDVSTTLTNDGTDQSIISKVTDNATSTIKADSIEDKVGTAKRSLTEAEIVDDVAGMTVKTNADGTLFTNGTNSTLINGSKLTSTNGAATGVLDGSNLTLTDGNKSTTMEAGKVTFKSETAGEHGGTETTIDGGTITTDTLNVERINLGGELLDSNGNPAGGNLSMDKEGNFSAAGGNFKVTGGSGADKGAMTNTVGNTTLKTDTTGAGMSYAGSVNSNVSIADGKANVSAGVGSIDVTNESITSKVGTDASSTITADSITDKVGGTTVETKDGSFSVKGNGGNGMNIDTNTGKTTFTGASGTTTIDGSTITTGKLITDELVITGQGDAAGDGNGSLAFGGNGTIKSDVKDGSDKNTQFTTDIDGVTTKVTDGTNTTTNEVAAAGNTNTVTNGTATSKNTQTATSIGGVITNGTVKIAQTLDGENGTITNEVTDKDGNSSKLEQNGTGLTYTDSANADNATRIDSKDVSIGSATDDSKRINLSDLGQIDDLDTELSARDEFKDNPTAVGGINAEAAARRADVARLDNRIDDVNERVDKVGAMAAAIASLKSIGYDPQAPSEFSVGLGQYKGETGVALGFFHYPNKNFMINVSLSTAGGETMGGIGATWRFGHKSPQKLLDEQREAQAKKELAAAEKYKAAAQLAKEAQERAEYAAKLARQAQVSADNAKAAADATQAKHLK